MLFLILCENDFCPYLYGSFFYETTYELIEPHVGDSAEFEAEEIVTRMMIPLCTEIVRCLEDGIVGSAVEADMALIYGIGFPVFRGGSCGEVRARRVPALPGPAAIEVAVDEAAPDPERGAVAGQAHEPTP